MPGYFIFNGRFYPESEKVIGPASHAFRYGDGLFETIRMVNGNCPLLELHFDRLFQSMEFLGYETSTLFTRKLLAREITRIAEKNRVSHEARIRLTVFRGDGGLYDLSATQLQYIINAWELPAHYHILNENGWRIDLFPLFKKAADPLGNLKSNNALIYVQAALYAKSNHLNEVLISNTRGTIADSTIANLFWVREQEIFTPPLEDGCVAGTFRRYLLEYVDKKKISCQEISCNSDELLSADEIFLTNALFGIRRVSEFKGKKYKTDFTEKLYLQLVPSLFK